MPHSNIGIRLDDAMGINELMALKGEFEKSLLMPRDRRTVKIISNNLQILKCYINYRLHKLKRSELLRTNMRC